MIFLKLLFPGIALILTLFACGEGAPKAQNPVVTPAKSPAIEDTGRQLFFEKGCIACHKINGEGGEVGPSLAGILGEMVELSTGEKVIRGHEYLEESILNPDARIVKGYQSGIMPKISLTHGQIHELEDFIRSLRKTR